MKLPSRAASAIHRRWTKYAGRRPSGAEVLRDLEARYATPDPWKMSSEKEQFRFARTNEILARELIAPAQQVGSILEIGCGEGHQSEYLKRLCHRLTGIDIVNTAIERARTRVPGVEWVRGDPHDQPWVAEGRKFDIVTACEVVYIFRDIPKTLQLMSRLGNACMVTYFGGPARVMKRVLREVPVAGCESFVFDDVTWRAVWWRST
jgi:SAM-dependent methyltransferase